MERYDEHLDNRAEDENEIEQYCEHFYENGECVWCGKRIDPSLDPRNEPEWWEDR